MDKQTIQSIQFDIEQLVIELKRIENEIQFYEGQLKFVKNGAGAVGAGGGGIAGLIAKQAFKSTPIGRAVAFGAFLTGAERGYDIADAATKTDEIKIFRLKEERDRIIKIIEENKRKINVQ
jgi:hypothetical protein